MVDQDENESGNPGHTHPEHEGAALDVRSAAKERRKGP
jgi:hypothetical protein